MWRGRSRLLRLRSLGLARRCGGREGVGRWVGDMVGDRSVRLGRRLLLRRRRGSRLRCCEWVSEREGEGWLGGAQALRMVEAGVKGSSLDVAVSAGQAIGLRVSIHPARRLLAVLLEAH